MSSQHSTHPRTFPLWAVLVLTSFVLFARLPGTGFVFDEQEAVLQNPYLRGNLPLSSAFVLDFWGLPASRSIGSYRPVPNLLWRVVSAATSLETPLFLQLVNPLIHGTNAWLLSRLALRWTGDRRVAMVSALVFATAGVATEAVSSVVGVADLLVVLATLLSLYSLSLAPGLREVCIFSLALAGLLSKETMLGGMPPIVLGVLLPSGPGGRPVGGKGTLTSVSLTLVLSVVAFVLVRRGFFLPPGALEAPILTAEIPGLGPLLSWMGQPKLPIDAQNNPLLVESADVRIATALRIYAANVLQMLVPLHLAADYSFPRIVPHGFDLGALVGAVLLVLPLLIVACWRPLRARLENRGERNVGVFLYGFAFVPLTAIPTSNLLVLLPTIRAERLLYLPLVGVALTLGWTFGQRWNKATWRRTLVFLSATSALCARAHALHYQSDVLFWRATTRGAPASAKAHLNLGVMLGARGDTEGRLRETTRAVDLAPDWGLAHVYLGDAKCRGKSPTDALPHYLKGLALMPNSRALASLALQCLWVRGQFDGAYDPLLRVAAGDPDGWLAYLLTRVVEEGDENDGLPPEYRPRGYNQPLEASIGPRSESHGSRLRADEPIE